MGADPAALRRSLTTLAIGVAGAAIATALGLPAAALIGAALATSAATWSGLRLQVPTGMRDAGFLTIGLSIGSGFQEGLLARAPDWAFSLLLLPVSVIATLLLGQWMLARMLRIDRTSALLAASPGTMSLAISLAADGRGTATQIVVIQSMRILMLAAGLPLLVASLGSSGGVALPGALMSLPELAGIALAALAIGLALKATGLPSAFLVGGMLASAGGHLAGLAHGTAPAWLLFAGFAITGSVVGSRFSGIDRHAILAMLRATLLLVAAASTVSACFAVAVAQLTDLPFAQVWIAYAPGGVEAMAAIGLALGFDPAYVALHHLMRIGLLTMTLPALTRRDAPR